MGSWPRREPSSEPLADELEPGEGREDGLSTDLGIAERHRDLLVAPGQLRGDDDAVTPAVMANAVAVAVATLARDHRPGRQGPGHLRRALPGLDPIVRRRVARVAHLVLPRFLEPSPEGPGSGTAGERFTFRGKVPRRSKRLAPPGAPGPAASLSEGRAAGPDRAPEPPRPPAEHEVQA